MFAALAPIVQEYFQAEAKHARRILHGRGRLFPGLETLNLDWFPPVLLVTTYEPLTDPDYLVDLLRQSDTLGQIESIILQQRGAGPVQGLLLWGREVDEIVVSEGELQFKVRPGRRQNAGLFLDMRPLREWLQNHSKNRNVLNLFAYSCSLSVAALAGGAREVTNVDMSRPSIQWGEENHRLNGQDLRCVNSIPHNLFTSWGRIQQYGRYDLVLIDPPTRQRGSFDVEKNYAAVLKKLPKLCTPGAEVIATLNSPFQTMDYLVDMFLAKVPGSTFIEQLPAAAEFADKFPEKGLKICRFRMQGASE